MQLNFLCLADDKGEKMKKAILMITVLALLFPACAFAEDFLGLPVPQGNETLRNKARLEMTTDLSHDEVLQFYKGVLEKAEEAQYRIVSITPPCTTI